jgi:hypothetical protein
MPRWRPIGISSAELKLQDGDCMYKIAGRCVIPDMPGVTGSDNSNANNALSLDHIYEQAHFGSDHRPENLLTVHRVCNSVRGSRSFVRFVGKDGARKIARAVPRVAPTILGLLGG